MISGRPLRDAAGAISGAALVYHDVTASRETERKLQQSQKLDAIGKLTGGVAHDFNNMLTVITGTTETLVARARAIEPALQKTAELIDQAAERCSELIQHLLAFARRQPLQPRNVDINGTVLDIAKLLRPTLGEQIEINSILEQEVATAHIDASQLANSAAQHGDQRPRRDAERRQAVAGDPQRRARRGLCAGQSGRRGPAPM